eukprot:TRINITY_DN9030_c0_g1_i6.p1 TRINITY_DN9030_c0_g1~~TRINITY_DN9030_c0_g1_i6.p1  ORF type:complete len:173 (+),score=30.91 TRINITY_DN9030_c0_g1_i6:474-992(+)
MFLRMIRLLSQEALTVSSKHLNDHSRFWDLARGVALSSGLLGANIGITYVGFMPNSEYILAGGLEGILGIYEVKTGVKKKKYEGILNANYPLHHSYGKIGSTFHIFGGSESDEAKVWDMKSEAIKYNIKLPKDQTDKENFVACVDYNEAAQRLAVCGPNSRNAAYLYSIPSQ